MTASEYRAGRSSGAIHPCDRCDGAGTVMADACPDCGHYAADPDPWGGCGECEPCAACDRRAHTDAMFDRWCAACAPDHTRSPEALLAVVRLVGEAARG